MTSTETARLLVAMPTYNGQAHLEAAIRSVLSQEDVDFQLLICDDASTDRTLQIARSFDDHRLSVVENEQRAGLTANWNRCVERCRSEYLCLFHQDDLMQPGNLAQKLACLESQPDVGWVYSAVDVVDEANDLVPDTLVSRDALSGEDQVFGPGEFLPILLVRNVVRASTVVVRRRCFEEVGPFNPDYRHVVDWEMWLRLASRFGVGWIASPLVTIRWHQASETHRQRERDTDLAEYRRLLESAIPQYREQLRNLPPGSFRGFTTSPDSVVGAAWRNLAEGHWNRSYLCLRVYRDPARARANLLSALRTSPVVATNFLRDPRFFLMASGLLIAPRTTAGLLNRLRPPRTAKEA